MDSQVPPAGEATASESLPDRGAWSPFNMTSTTWSGTVAEQNGNNMPGVTYGVVFVHATPVSSGPTVDASISVVGG